MLSRIPACNPSLPSKRSLSYFPSGIEAVCYLAGATHSRSPGARIRAEVRDVPISLPLEGSERKGGKSYITYLGPSPV